MKSKRSPRVSSQPGPRFSWSLEETLPYSHVAPGLVAPATIARCIERGIARGQLNLVLSQLPKHQGLSAVDGVLTAVNDYCVDLELRVRTVNAPGRPVTIRVVVARNDRDRGELLKRDIAHLRWAMTRLPKHVPAIGKAGTVFQADKHGRDEHHRRLPAYTTNPLPVLGIVTFGNREQLAIEDRTPRLLTRNETDRIRQRVIELCLRAHDPNSRRALPPPELGRGALRLGRASRSAPEPFIAGCPTLWDRVDDVTLLHRLAGFEWKKGNDILPLLPPAPEALLAACVNALGKQAGRALLSRYAGALASGRFPEHRRLPRAVLAPLLDA